jgi:hypothetical protein
MAVIPEDIMGELTFGMNFIISESGSGIMIEDNREPPNLPEGAFERFWERIKGFR